MPQLRALLGPLRVLHTVFRFGSVARAAEILHITPGAVSHQLRKLESHLKVQVVTKSGRDIDFTQTGGKLALRMADLFDRMEEVVAETVQVGPNRPIRVKIIPTLAIQWLMPRLASFYAQHPDIDLEIATVAQADDTGLHNADFVVRRGAGHWEALRADLLYPDELVTVCAPGMAEYIRHPSDILKEKLLKSLIAPDAWSEWFSSAGMHADNADTRYIPLANAALCLQAAEQGLGVAVTQRAYMSRELASGTLVQASSHIAVSGNGYYLVYDPEKWHSEPFRQFAQWLVASARGRGT